MASTLKMRTFTAASRRLLLVAAGTVALFATAFPSLANDNWPATRRRQWHQRFERASNKLVHEQKYCLAKRVSFLERRHADRLGRLRVCHVAFETEPPMISRATKKNGVAADVSAGAAVTA